MNDKMPKHPCQNCTEKCPQAEMAHNAALGRMYATKELVSILKKVESGKLVEVVRCKDCKYWHEEIGWCDENSHFFNDGMNWDIFEADDFCSYGERKDNG